MGGVLWDESKCYDATKTEQNTRYSLLATYMSMPVHSLKSNKFVFSWNSLQ